MTSIAGVPAAAILIIILAVVTAGVYLVSSGSKTTSTKTTTITATTTKQPTTSSASTTTTIANQPTASSTSATTTIAQNSAQCNVCMPYQAGASCPPSCPNPTPCSGGGSNLSFSCVASQKASYNNTFVVFNPLNLSQISWMSKFRSCVGHNFSGYDANGTIEPTSSMKHYIAPFSYIAQQSISVYAPFNGYVVSLTNDTPGTQIWLRAWSNSQWDFRIFHQTPLPGIAVGANVVAGQLISHPNLPPGGDFDFALSKAQTYQFNNFTQHLSTFDTPFTHMVPSVYQQYVAVGVTLNSIIISLSYRLANPCTCTSNLQDPQNCRFSGISANDTITLSH